MKPSILAIFSSVASYVAPTLTPSLVSIRDQQVLENFAGRRQQGGYVFNLGHGIHPGSSLENVQAMIDTVRNY